MKQIITFIFSLLLSGIVVAGTPTTVSLSNSTPNSLTIKFNPGDYTLTGVYTPEGEASILSIENGSPLLRKGAPDLPKLTRSFIIPDAGEMKVSVTASTFYDVPNIAIAPSKGNLYRNVNPDEIPYQKGAEYTQNAFFPADLATLYNPFILRDYRAQTVSVCPFQYNPQTKTLRVYTSITVAIEVQSTQGGRNEFVRDPSFTATATDAEMNVIYKQQFINFSNIAAKSSTYTPVSESGSMLVICYDDFKADIAPFVKWKNQKGIPTELVLKSVAGTTAAAIKKYIATYYASHPTLKYVLLIGDAPQIPSSKTTAGDSDNDYGYITGADSYPEVFMGRFSATTSAQVQTMVNRTIAYEKTPQRDGVWYKKGITIGSDQGPGDNNEYDWQHQRKIRTALMGYKYNDVTENYDGSQGGVDKSGSPTASMISTQINAGVGIITYTGHGASTQFVTSGFSSSNATALTNDKMHPFVWSVACVNGDFVSGTCLAEAFTRAGTPTKPTGALATLMSTINQSWNPPMAGQDAMVDILVESKAGNIKRTFGGLSMNGCMQMNDTYPKGGSGDFGAEMTDTWTIFGDPSVMVFTDTPGAMSVSHVSKTPLNTTSITVNCNVKDALVCLSKDGVILGTGISNGTSVVVTIPATTTGTIDVVATAYNKMPYMGTVIVDGTTGMDELANADHLQIYPVPASSAITVSGELTSAGKIKLAVYNNLGQEILLIANESAAAGSFTKTIDVSALPAGVYFCKLETGISTKIQRVIIQH
jgi:hypothetical protein